MSKNRKKSGLRAASMGQGNSVIADTGRIRITDSDSDDSSAIPLQTDSDSDDSSTSPLRARSPRSRSNSSTSSSSSSKSASSSSLSSISSSVSRTRIRFSSGSESDAAVERNIQLPSVPSSADESSTTGTESRRVMSSLSTRSLRSHSGSSRSGSSISTPSTSISVTTRGRGRGRPGLRRNSSASSSSMLSASAVLSAQVVDLVNPPNTSTSSTAVRIEANQNNPTTPISQVRQAEAHWNMNILNASMSGGNFECIVCLESLSSAATVLEERVVSEGNAPADMNVPGGQGIHGHANEVMHGAIPAGVGRGRGRGRAPPRRRVPIVWDPREIASTPCGHLYHRYCIEKWFTEQGKKTCPSCRKAIPGKMIRLYPNMGQDTQNRYVPAPLAIPVQPQPPPRAATAPGLVSTPSAAAPNVPLVPRQVPNSNCMNASCADFHDLHRTLVSDYNDLQERYYTARDDLTMRNVEMQSLQESYDQLTQELEQTRATSGATGVKRRRQR